MLTLEVHDGAATRVLTFDTEVVRIGRDPSSELCLPGDTSVSRAHARVVRTPEGWSLADAGSRNGVILNGRRIEAPVALTTGDRFLVGPFLLVLADSDGADLETTPASGRAVPASLSARELEVLRLVASGASDQEIADHLVVSVRTVHTHLERIRDKTGERRRAELTRWAMHHGLA